MMMADCAGKAYLTLGSSLVLAEIDLLMPIILSLERMVISLVILFIRRRYRWRWLDDILLVLT